MPGKSERESVSGPTFELLTAIHATQGKASQARVALAKVFRKYRPEIVIGIGDKTPMASPDHWQAMQITDAAVFYARLTKWDQHFDHLPVHTVSTQLYYTLAFASLGLPPAR